ncbi:MAG: XRE family transcriptional regulator [Candidatus Margulisbacteria bacterium]|nr:XRE family transcriptional regulator [Candidatus Margulisiibacteriota bacterium]
MNYIDSRLPSNYDLVIEETRPDMIGELIREAKKEISMSQEELAALAHTKPSANSRLERHTSDIKLSTLSLVSKALGKRLEIPLK